MTTPRGAPWAALAYLYTRSIRNRWQAQIRRVRSPRYVAAMIFGALYIWGTLFRNTRPGRGGGPLNSLVHTDLVPPVLLAVLLGIAARWWLFGTNQSALAFPQAEVQFLFPAPVTRRQLLQAKLIRLQLAILLNTIIFSVILRGNAGTAGGWRRGIALWIAFSVFALHRLGATLVRSTAVEHARPGIKRSVVPAGIFAGMVGAVIWGLTSAWPALHAAQAEGIGALFRATTAALQQPLPATALWPVRAVIQPLFSTDASAWWHALPAALVVLAIHYLGVLRLDLAFEEAALEASQRRAEKLHRFRTTQMRDARSKSGKVAWIPRLSWQGSPTMAVVWKNTAAALRGGQWRRTQLIFSAMLILMAVLARSSSRGGGEAFATVVTIWGAMMLFLGPLWMRYDLRFDLPRLAILKTWPLPGRQVVAAEIGTVTVLQTLSLWALMCIPVAVAVMDPLRWTSQVSNLPSALAVALAIPAINALLFTVHNAMALLFPAWVRLGTEPRGFETMGQNLLTTGATTLVAAVALVFPVGLGFLVLLFGHNWNGWAWPVAVVLGSSLVLLELWPIMHWLGEVFERTEVSDVG